MDTMTFENDLQKAFLLELYRSADGAAGVQRSMHAVGAAVGMDKERASRTAEDLIGKGWVEIKTLSGGIGLTAEGIEVALQEGAGGGSGGGSLPRLGKAVFLAEPERTGVEKMVAEIKQNIPSLKTEYAQLEEMVLDLKTAEVQLLSPRAKTAVIREVLRALQTALAKAGARDTAERIERMIG
jgi:hypothetical protein